MEIELDLLGSDIGTDSPVIVLSYNLNNIDGIGELWYSNASYYTEGII